MSVIKLSVAVSRHANAPVAMARRWNKRAGGKVQKGVGLIEVMMAVLVLSIGFLGVGAMLAMSLSTNNSAMANSMATISSYSILDAMRADIVNAKAGAYNTASPVVANACPAASGSLASVQLNAWCVQLGKNLGVASTTKGTVNCTGTGDCTITIQFDDSRSGGGGFNAGSVGSSTQTITTRARL